MKILARIIPILLIIASPVIGTPLREEHVSADAKWLLHLDAQRFKDSQIGEYIMKEFVAPNIPAAGPLNLNLQEVVKLIEGITIFGESMDFEKMEEDFDGIALIQAHPDLRAMLEAVIVMAQMQEGEELPFTVLQESPYKLIDVDGELKVAFFGDTLIALGRASEAMSGFAELAAGNRADLSKNLTYQEFGMGEGTVTLLAAAEGFDQLGNIPQAQILKMTNGFLIRLDERDSQVTLDATLTTVDDKTATQVRQVLQGVLAMAALANIDQVQVAELLRSAHTEAVGTKVNLGATFPVVDLLAMVESLKPPVIEGTDSIGGEALAVKITKTSVDGRHIPSNIIDGDENTYWTAPGMGQWIEIRFTSPAKVETLELLWHKGKERQQAFKVQALTPAGAWTDLFEGNSGADLRNLETIGYEFVPIPVTTTEAIRITGNGNTVNHWNSLAELRVNGGVIKPFKVYSIADDKALPENLFDKNTDTVWDTYTRSPMLEGVMDNVAVIREIGIVWSRGSQSSVHLETSMDSLAWTPVLSVKGTVEPGKLQKYNVIDTAAKYIRIKPTEDGDWGLPAEFVLYGDPVNGQ